MNPGGLRSYLGEERNVASRLLPGSLSKLLMPAAAAVGLAGQRRAPSVRVATVAPERRAFPWWLVGLLALVGIGAFAWSRLSHRELARRASNTVEMAAPAAPLMAGNVSALSTFLDGNGAVPRRFLLEDLTFRTDSADIEGTSRQVLDDVAGVLAAHRSTRVRVEGHTDSTGAADTNRRLSEARAEATKQYLAVRGVDPTRIEAVGNGGDQPIATNDTAAGRAQNRRTELVVTHR
jgi:outer membrane protein OmpA-like peptidoglycan-associated protein